MINENLEYEKRFLITLSSRCGLISYLVYNEDYKKEFIEQHYLTRGTRIRASFIDDIQIDVVKTTKKKIPFGVKEENTLVPLSEFSDIENIPLKKVRYNIKKSGYDIAFDFYLNDVLKNLVTVEFETTDVELHKTTTEETVLSCFPFLNTPDVTLTDLSGNKEYNNWRLYEKINGIKLDDNPEYLKEQNEEK